MDDSFDIQGPKVGEAGSGRPATVAGGLPDITIIIEWENAIDVVDEWTGRAMEGLARELAAVAPRLPRAPRITYLYDRNAVPDGTIEAAIERIAPQLRTIADVQVVPTDGLSYYKLKNYGIARSRTDLSVLIDSDAAPQPGWLDALLSPFADPKVMAVGGFTTLGHDGFLSRAMALSWIFDLKGDEDKTARRQSLHVNNCAVRTAFFRDHPFQELPTFKKACVFWLRGILSEGHGFVRTPKARAIHAPHPGIKFLAWRAWTAGYDADFVAFHSKTKSRIGRFFYAFPIFAKRLGRAWSRILLRGDTVGMPLWERPPALIVPLLYYGVVWIAQMTSALSRRFGPLPPFKPMAFVES